MPAAASAAHPSGRVVIVAGAGTRRSRRARPQFAERQRIPVLADPLSGARRGGAAIAHYDLLLRDSGFTAERRPEFVLRIGDLPTSKPLRAWLASLGDVPQIAFDPTDAGTTRLRCVGMRIAQRATRRP